MPKAYNEAMKVSVVIPAFNEEKYIKMCLESVIGQVVGADEIVVIDNNSTDKTVEIVKKMGIRIVSEKAQGMIPARNRGFNEAKFEIIARCDADVIVPKDWIKKIKKNFDKNKIDALSGPISYYGSKLVSKSPAASVIYLKSLKMLSGKHYLIGPNMSLTNDIWQRIKNEVASKDSDVHEDIDLSLKIHKSNGVIGYDSTLIVQSSARRITGKPESFFLEYPARMVKTFVENKKGS